MVLLLHLRLDSVNEVVKFSLSPNALRKALFASLAVDEGAVQQLVELGAPSANSRASSAEKQNDESRVLW